MNKQPSHVLLIEDNPGDADLVRLRLVEANSDLDVSCVDRLSDGLASISEEAPSVVLLDLNLPDSRGAETFRSVLNRAPGVPVVVLSGHDDEELATKAVHQGVLDYLVKGHFDSKQLARAMRYAVERQSLLTSLDMSRKQQLQFKDEFLSHVSHELRTPLTAIHQFVTILLDGIAGTVPPEQREHLQTILKSSQQLRAMIGDLLEATRAESGKLRVEPRCIAIEDVPRQGAAMLRATAQEKQVGLEIAIDNRVPLVRADPERVLQVLLNLIDNAIKFTPPHGSVILRACLFEADPDFVYISVTDTGRGISPEVKPLIFERLYQDPKAISDSRKGLGLGLYIAKELVRLQGGRIWVESQLGHGSIFSFTLPLFSLAKLLSPVIAQDGHLRDALVLFAVDLIPLVPPALCNWKDLTQQCLEVLRQCIFPDRDIVLPIWGNRAMGETFLIVASADQNGTNILWKRISDQLERCPALKNKASFRVSAKDVHLPAVQPEETLDKQVRKVADDINEMVIAILDQNGSEAEKQ